MDATTRARLDQLTPRERHILELVAEGLTVEEIASHIGIAARTVQAHRRRIMQTLDVSTPAELVRVALRTSTP